MYSDKNIVNLLTSLLIAKGIKKAVVCPGSRNIPIISNLRTVKEIECISVIDERSAAYMACGLSAESGRIFTGIQSRGDCDLCAFFLYRILQRA